MNFKRFHESKNLFDKYAEYTVGQTAYQYTISGLTPNQKYTCSTNFVAETGKEAAIYFNGGSTVTNGVDYRTPKTFTCGSSGTMSVYVRFQSTSQSNPAIYDDLMNGTIWIMVNEGSTALPYESYSSEVWHDIPYYKHSTATDTLSLPATLYPNDTSITVGVKGQSSQNGTPSPSLPVDVVGVGESETIGEHSGQYKIPILCGNQTTNIYLGETQSTRAVKKLVLDGTTEGWVIYNGNYYSSVTDRYSLQNMPCICTHTAGGIVIDAGNVRLKVFASRFTAVASNLEEWKTYLQQQYQNGTPVTVWYVLATPEITIINEPLMKIGDYADEVTGISIPVTAGANTLSVGTTLQPSEVTATYHGWHPVSAVHERDNGAWT